MSNSFIPNQVVKFNYVNPLCCDMDNYCQPVEQDDYISFQFASNPCHINYGDNLILNGDFSDGLNEWDQSDTGVDWTNVSNTASVSVNQTNKQSKQLVNTANVFNCSGNADIPICFTVTGLTGNPVYINVLQTGGSDCTVPVILESYSVDGTYCFNAPRNPTCTALGFQVIYTGTEGSATVTIDNVTAECGTYENCVAVCVKDADGNTTNVPDGSYSYTQGSLNVTFKWSDLSLPDGCYTLCICNGADSLETNLFTNGDNGTFEKNISGVSGASIAHTNVEQHSGSYSCGSSGTFIPGFSYQQIQILTSTVSGLTPGKTYTIEGYVMENNSSGPYANSFIGCDLLLTTDQSEISHVGESTTAANTWYKISTKFIATSSTMNIAFKAGVLYEGIVQTNCYTYSIQNTSAFPIVVNYTDCTGVSTNISISTGGASTVCVHDPYPPTVTTPGGTFILNKELNCDTLLLDWVQQFYTDDIRVYENVDYCSQTFCLKSKHDCTLLLEFTNSTNAFGIDYSAGFTQYLRLNAQLVYSRYQEVELDYYQYVSGDTSLLYAKSNKIYELAVNDVPEYVHDALRIALYNRTFSIDGIQYIKYKGDYLPIKKRNSTNYGVKVEVYQADENTVNTTC